MAEIGKSIIIIGALLIIIGLLVTFSSKIPYLGKLPGDIYIHKKGVTFYFPLATSIILSAIFSIILYLLRK